MANTFHLDSFEILSVVKITVASVVIGCQFEEFESQKSNISCYFGQSHCLLYTHHFICFTPQFSFKSTFSLS